MARILLALTLMAALATAQPRGMMMDDDQPVGPMHTLKALNLTDDQAKQVDKLKTDMQKERIALRSKVQTMRIDLRQQMDADTPDRAKIESMMQDIGKLQTEMKLKRNAFWFDVNKLLTADQQKVWKEHRGMAMREGRMGKKGMMHGRGMKRGRGMMQHEGRNMMECGGCDHMR